MWSGEGENVPFHEPLYPTGNVEDWLLEVENMMRGSLREILRRALEKYPEVSPKEFWGSFFYFALILFRYPHDCIILKVLRFVFRLELKVRSQRVLNYTDILFSRQIAGSVLVVKVRCGKKSEKRKWSLKQEAKQHMTGLTEIVGNFQT